MRLPGERWRELARGVANSAAYGLNWIDEFGQTRNADMKYGLFDYLAVAGAGALGAVTRLFVATLFSRDFPVGTMLINITGSLFLGWFMTIAEQRVTMHATLKVAIATGFVGAYTTFSTYMYESDDMLSRGDSIKALLYLFGSLALGLVAVRAGVLLGQKL
jgi:fluoride exporter